MGGGIWLERPFKEEVFEVVKAFNCDKALRPNRFTVGFFQACWEVPKVDIMNVFHNFHAKGMFGKGLNASFIYLITKKSGAGQLTLNIVTYYLAGWSLQNCRQSSS
jgi:hypothetical protein